MCPNFKGNVRCSQYDLSRLAEDHFTDIVNTVYLGVIDLEDTNDIVRLSKVALASSSRLCIVSLHLPR